MHPRSTLSLSQRELLVELFESGLGSQSAAVELQVSKEASKSFYRRWKLHGRLVLVDKSSKDIFPFEVKREVVDRFLAGESKMELAEAFGLSSPQIISLWVRRWRAGGDDALKPQRAGRPAGSARKEPATEEELLRRRVKLLEAENAYLKKLRDLRGQGHA